jgi:TRAP-type C4-dicarboxylate transport system permease small subunit
MKSMLKGTRKILRAVGLFEIGAVTFMLAMTLVLILVQVFMRKVFNQPNAWAEEAAIYLFIWITMVGSSIAMKMLRHITIKTFVSSLNRGPKFILRLFVYIGMTATVILVLVNMPKILKVEFMSKTVALPIQLPRAYFFSIPLLYSMFSILVCQIYYILACIQEFITGNEMNSIMEPDFLEIKDTYEGIEVI